MTAGRPPEEDSRPGRAAMTAMARAAVAAAAAAGRANGSGTEPPSSATFVWTLPGTRSSVCAATCSGTRRGGGLVTRVEDVVFVCVRLLCRCGLRLRQSASFHGGTAAYNARFNARPVTTEETACYV